MAEAKQITRWEEFSTELKQREHEICSQLPSNVSAEKFTNCAIAAIKKKPEILTASPRSLFSAITQAAQDGLLPDGKEGVINVYNEKVKVNGKDVWEPTAKWQPMTYGIRKRARELDDILIDAQVVYQNDAFSREQGDQPRITHVPAPLGQQRGAMVGAYAIFKKDGVILHREVMDMVDIGKVKECSRSPGGLLWTTFEDEAWRKTVVRRGAKTVPVSESLEQIIRRDDDQFTFPDDPTPARGELSAIAIPARPKESAFRNEDKGGENKPAGQTIEGSAKPAAEKTAEKPQQQIIAPSDAGAPTDTQVGEAVVEGADQPVGEQVAQTGTSEPDEQAARREGERLDLIKDLYGELEALKKVKEVADKRQEGVDSGILTVDEEKAWHAACDAKARAIQEAFAASRRKP